jgi:plastocyanin
MEQGAPERRRGALCRAYPAETGAVTLQIAFHFTRFFDLTYLCTDIINVTAQLQKEVAMKPRKLVFMLPILILFMTAANGAPKEKAAVKEATAVLSEAGIQEITVDIRSYFFEPNRIVVKVNVPVRMTLKSHTSLVPHNITLNAPEAGITIHQDIGHGKTATVEFTPTKVGEYSFFCDKGSHAKKGMTGTLVVVP